MVVADGGYENESAGNDHFSFSHFSFMILFINEPIFLFNLSS
jgi:hypothetical protein